MLEYEWAERREISKEEIEEEEKEREKEIKLEREKDKNRERESEDLSLSVSSTLFLYLLLLYGPKVEREKGSDTLTHNTQREAHICTQKYSTQTYKHTHNRHTDTRTYDCVVSQQVEDERRAQHRESIQSKIESKIAQKAQLRPTQTRPEIYLKLHEREDLEAKAEANTNGATTVGGALSSNLRKRMRESEKAAALLAE
eukprot:1354444-Amorphochlora_amoeboformis.AAC.4